MSRDTEKALANAQKYLDSHKDEIQSEEDIDRLLQQYMDQYNSAIRSGKNSEELSVYDLLDKADQAETPAEQRRWLKKALALEPDNLDAQAELLNLDTEDPLEFLNGLLDLKKNADETSMKTYLKENAGHFYGILETRPYIRLLRNIMEMELNLDMYRLACETGEEIIRLNRNDNTGVRFTLISLYAVLEEEKKAEAVYRRYTKDGLETMLSLAMSILYYKLNRIDEAQKYLYELADINDGTVPFFKDINKKKMPQKMIAAARAPYYPPFSYEELCLLFIGDCSFLCRSAGWYTVWASETLKGYVPSAKRS